MRQTWLVPALSLSVEVAFFVAVPRDGLLPSALLHEMATHRDMCVRPQGRRAPRGAAANRRRVTNWTESYAATVHKVWGVRTCGAHYVARANDDVYLRLGPTMKALFGAGPPSRLYAGLFIDGTTMTVPRIEQLQVPDGVLRDDWLASVKAWTVSRADYPADQYPTFAQGNAYILSRDLADSVASLADKPWMRLNLPDDVLVGLIVDSATAGNPRRLDVRADYELEGRWTRCTDAALWHFNIHYEHMYHLHLAEPTTSTASLEIVLDDDTVLLEFDRDTDDLASLATHFAETHRALRGEGCSPGDSHCLALQLESALRTAPILRGEPPSPCSRVPDRLFCCG